MGLLATGAELRRLALTQAAGPRSSGRIHCYGQQQCSLCGTSPVEKEVLAESCVWTCGTGTSALRGMAEIYDLDEDTRALVEQLCTCVGMLMEDASVQALVRAASLDDLHLKVERLGFAVRHMDRLLSAAGALLHLHLASEATVLSIAKFRSASADD